MATLEAISGHFSASRVVLKVVIGYVLAPQACRSPPAFPARCAWRVSRSAAERRAAGACAGWASSGQCCAAAPWRQLQRLRRPPRAAAIRARSRCSSLCASAAASPNIICALALRGTMT